MMKRERIIWSLFIALLVLIMANIILAKKTPSDNKKLFWMAKTHAPQHYDIVVIGDSRIYRGISPEAIASAVQGAEVLNFGYSSAGFSNRYLDAATQKLRKTARHPVVVIGITPHSITPKAWLNEHFEEQSSINREEIIEQLYFGDILQRFPSISPAGLRNYIKNKHKRENYIQRYTPNGWIASDYRVRDTTYALQSYMAVFQNNKSSNYLLEQLAEKIEKWRLKDISVFVFRPPATVTMHQLENIASGFDEKAVIRRLKKAGAVWIETDSLQLTSYDGSHLTKESAEKLSIYIGKQIAKSTGED